MAAWHCMFLYFCKILGFTDGLLISLLQERLLLIVHQRPCNTRWGKGSKRATSMQPAILTTDGNSPWGARFYLSARSASRIPSFQELCSANHSLISSTFCLALMISSLKAGMISLGSIQNGLSPSVVSRVYAFEDMRILKSPSLCGGWDWTQRSLPCLPLSKER